MLVRMRSENHSFAGGYVSFLCEATASHTLRSSLSQYSQYYDYGVARLAVAMQLTRLMAGYLDVSFRRSERSTRCRVSTT